MDKEQRRQIQQFSDQLKLMDANLVKIHRTLVKLEQRLDLGFVPEVRAMREQIDVFLNSAYGWNDHD